MTKSDMNSEFNPEDELTFIPAEPPKVKEPEEEEPLTLVEDVDIKPSAGTNSVKTWGGPTGGLNAGIKKKGYKRDLNMTGTGATRCRLFHSRIATAPLEYMENQINDWLDSEHVEVKHVGHNVGIMEGKSNEPNLIVMVWY